MALRHTLDELFDETDEDDYDSLQRFYREVRKHERAVDAHLPRVIVGYDAMLRAVCDPHADVLEVHPVIDAAFRMYCTEMSEEGV